MTARFKSVDKIAEESQCAFRFDYFFGMSENYVIRFITRCQNRILHCTNIHTTSNSRRVCQLVEDDSSYVWPFWFFEEIEENDDEN